MGIENLHKNLRELNLISNYQLDKDIKYKYYIDFSKLFYINITSSLNIKNYYNKIISYFDELKDNDVYLFIDSGFIIEKEPERNRRSLMYQKYFEQEKKNIINNYYSLIFKDYKDINNFYNNVKILDDNIKINYITKDIFNGTLDLINSIILKEDIDLYLKTNIKSSLIDYCYNKFNNDFINIDLKSNFDIYNFVVKNKLSEIDKSDKLDESDKRRIDIDKKLFKIKSLKNKESIINETILKLKNTYKNIDFIVCKSIDAEYLLTKKYILDSINFKHEMNVKLENKYISKLDLNKHILNSIIISNDQDVTLLLLANYSYNFIINDFIFVNNILSKNIAKIIFCINTSDYNKGIKNLSLTITEINKDKIIRLFNQEYPDIITLLAAYIFNFKIIKLEKLENEINNIQEIKIKINNYFKNINNYMNFNFFNNDKNFKLEDISLLEIYTYLLLYFRNNGLKDFNYLNYVTRTDIIIDNNKCYQNINNIYRYIGNLNNIYSNKKYLPYINNKLL